MRRAVIDIGTNSVKLLVADVEGSAVKPLLERAEQTRLGRGFYEGRCLQAEAVADTARVVAEFATAARTSRTDSIRVIATSAVRDATNQHDLLDAIRRACALPVEVISGEQEAEWAFRGVTSDPALAGRRLLILDIGGGSTEFVFGVEQHVIFRDSFPCGSVRLLERFPPGDPPTANDWQRTRQALDDFIRGEVCARLGPLLREHASDGLELVGTGGTTSILARMELRLATFARDAIEGRSLSLATVRAQRELVWTLPLAERRRLVGLPPNRADVILMGVAICEAVMKHLRFDAVRVSTRGLRFGALAKSASVAQPG
jgi:exopolyphosphatase/guanosine-5'-triphosphate,3'-diphosphate pyrophosphatase